MIHLDHMYQTEAISNTKVKNILHMEKWLLIPVLQREQKNFTSLKVSFFKIQSTNYIIAYIYQVHHCHTEC